MTQIAVATCNHPKSTETESKNDNDKWKKEHLSDNGFICMWVQQKKKIIIENREMNKE